MYDLIRLVFNQERRIPSRLNITSEQPNQTESRIVGRIDNLTIQLYPYTTIVRGSLGRFLTGNLIHALSFSEVAPAIRKLEDALEFPVSDAVITELEFGPNIETARSPAHYLRQWGQVPRYQRTEINFAETVRYSVTEKSFQGYDKVRQLRAGKLLEEYRGKNLLRFQLKYKVKAGVSSIFGRPLTGADLSGPELYSRLLDELQRWYFSIPKTNLSVSTFSGHKKSELMSHLAALGMATGGTVARLMAEISARNDLNSQQRYELRNELKKINNTATLSQPTDLTMELDQKFRKRINDERTTLGDYGPTRRTPTNRTRKPVDTSRLTWFEKVLYFRYPELEGTFVHHTQTESSA